MNPTGTATASVTRARDLSAALDDAIRALTALDAEKLEVIGSMVADTLEVGGRGNVFAAEKTERQRELREVSARHKLLGSLLESTSLNLGVLKRMHERSVERAVQGDLPWVR